MTLNDTSSLKSHLATRRSGRPRDLVEPGPSEEELAEILRLAARTPDHGKLVPYRFVVVGKEARDALAALYEQALRRDGAHEAKIAKSVANAHAAPTLVILISSPVRDHKIPVFEQELTCGAAGMNLLHAAHAHGYVGGWITGWPAYDLAITDAFCNEGERIAGLIYLGTSACELEERERPDMGGIVSRWG
ncbi:nitroreductase family protein [Sphingomicrobium clamense]|uniref:Putative NAD(P)H nitroreductase n=1 Tax=Sphingomicrobium clamense TaxID=2851013 RepID=A0ABS6V6Y3_9SPHN|nr:nitroreductase [Sphingomicrobium sp. B8]MBW0145326.1 nitroreductase [Sphingomicrobium sp. B8]